MNATSVASPSAAKEFIGADGVERIGLARHMLTLGLHQPSPRALRDTRTKFGVPCWRYCCGQHAYVAISCSTPCPPSQSDSCGVTVMNVADPMRSGEPTTPADSVVRAARRATEDGDWLLTRSGEIAPLANVILGFDRENAAHAGSEWMPRAEIAFPAERENPGLFLFKHLRCWLAFGQRLCETTPASPCSS